MWTYILQPGETLDIVATRFETRVTALEAANPGIRLKPLTPGQNIHIPGLPTYVAKYKVKAGENFDTIGKNFRTNATLIEALNPSIVSSDVEIGQIINVPQLQGRNLKSYQDDPAAGIIVEDDAKLSGVSRSKSPAEILGKSNLNGSSIASENGQFLNVEQSNILPPQKSAKSHYSE